MSAPALAHLPPVRIGQAHGRWRGGVTFNEKGYRRISHGAYRNRYEHRRVIEEMLEHPLCASYVFPEPGQIPSGLTVEHIDHRRAHNCRSNLMLLDSRIHNAITAAGCRYIREHYVEYLAAVQGSEVPDWVTESEVA